jgi:hypothetical protein
MTLLSTIENAFTALSGRKKKKLNSPLWTTIAESLGEEPRGNEWETRFNLVDLSHLRRCRHCCPWQSDDGWTDPLLTPGIIWFIHSILTTENGRILLIATGTSNLCVPLKAKTSKLNT